MRRWEPCVSVPEQESGNLIPEGLYNAGQAYFYSREGVLWTPSALQRCKFDTNVSMDIFCLQRGI